MLRAAHTILIERNLATKPNVKRTTATLDAERNAHRHPDQERVGERLTAVMA
jgi:hypothetical protein